MTDYANIALVIAGLVPITISATKVEKYYTEFYGYTLIILGFILDEQIYIELMIIAIFFII
ncbi:MAG: hypothetical protein K9W44_10200 [Candidatus Lokiarchaeota archaeon]|nr:hypothetical protein [Candidatus Harpocratesius repetitus]